MQLDRGGRGRRAQVDNDEADTGGAEDSVLAEDDTLDDRAVGEREQDDVARLGHRDGGSRRLGAYRRRTSRVDVEAEHGTAGGDDPPRDPPAHVAQTDNTDSHATRTPRPPSSTGNRRITSGSCPGTISAPGRASSRTVA